MGTVVRFPRRRHVRNSAGSRAANAVKSSAVTPFSEAFGVASSADHHSEGILSRLSHLRTAQEPAPTSAAISSREGHKSMIERNEVKSDMTESMGQSVPKIKAIVSHDYMPVLGHSVPMSQDDENIAETAWREAFCERLREVQGKRTQDQMATVLGISRDNWNKYINRGSAVPIRLLPKIAAVGAKSLEWLIGGDKQPKPASKPAPNRRKTAKQA